MDDVAEVGRWAEGIERCMGASPAGSGVRSRGDGRWSTCGVCSVRWNARTVGSWRSRRATPLPMVCSVCYPPTGGTRTRFAMTSRTTWSSIWATPTGRWWWTCRLPQERRQVRWGAAAVQRHCGADRELPGGSILGLRRCQGQDPAGPGVVSAAGMVGGPRETPGGRGAGVCRIPHQASVGPDDAGAGGGIGNPLRLGYWRRGLRQRPQPAAGTGGHPPRAGHRTQRKAVGFDGQGTSSGEG